MNKLKNLGKLISLIRLKMTLRSKATKDAATFGVMPHYSFEGKGMRMESVSAGKTAEKHGFKNGDVITKIDANPVTNLMSYMTVLSKYQIGDKVQVTFLREGEEMMKEVEFM